MNRWLSMAALLLALGAAAPSWAGDVEDCLGAVSVDKAVLSACLRLGEQGSAKAQYTLGVMYATGDGAPQYYSEAAKWYQKAADQDVGLVQLQLGGLYASGRGVPLDCVQAYMWFNLAAAHTGEVGSEEAAKDRDHTAQLMTPAQIAEAQKLTSEWKPHGM